MVAGAAQIFSMREWLEDRTMMQESFDGEETPRGQELFEGEDAGFRTVGDPIEGESGGGQEESETTTQEGGS